MNHTIKGIIIVVAIASMLFVGATSMFPIMQNSLAHKKSDFKGADRDTNTNTNTNTNSADSSSSSSATAENTNNITNLATASNSQEQSACAVALTCPEGSTTVTPPPPDPCPHSPYTDFVAGTGCQNGEPTPPTCNPSTVGGFTATPTDGTCTATLPAGATIPQMVVFNRDCFSIPGGSRPTTLTCTFPATQICPPPEGSTQTPTVVSGRCTIQPGAT